MILLRRLEQEAYFYFVMIFLEVTCISILNFFFMAPRRNLAQNELSHIDVNTFAHLSTLERL